VNVRAHPAWAKRVPCKGYAPQVVANNAAVGDTSRPIALSSPLSGSVRAWTSRNCPCTAPSPAPQRSRIAVLERQLLNTGFCLRGLSGALRRARIRGVPSGAVPCVSSLPSPKPGFTCGCSCRTAAGG